MPPKGMKLSNEAKKKISEAHKGEGNGMWKGDKVGYNSLHDWVRTNVPRPKSGLCELCNQVPFYDAMNISGKYLRIKTDWKHTCRKCHMESDGRLERFKINRNSNQYRDTKTGRFIKNV